MTDQLIMRLIAEEEDEVEAMFEREAATREAFSACEDLWPWMTQFRGENESNLDFQWRGGCGKSKKEIKPNRLKEPTDDKTPTRRGNNSFGMLKTWS